MSEKPTLEQDIERLEDVAACFNAAALDRVIEAARQKDVAYERMVMALDDLRILRAEVERLTRERDDCPACTERERVRAEAAEFRADVVEGKRLLLEGADRRALRVMISLQGSAVKRAEEAEARVERLRETVAAADRACGDLAEALANDADHHALKHPTWYRAVKRYRRLRAALAEEPKSV